MEPKDMTTSQLRTQLLTTDFGGKVWKEECLKELVEREISYALMSIVT